MASTGTVGDAVQVYLSGALANNAYQSDVDAALGGYRSSVRASSLTMRRPSALPGLTVTHASGANGTGNGVLTCQSASTVSWTPPNGTVGTAVTIANGETKLLIGGGTEINKWVVVTRTSATDLAGVEVVQLLDTFNNVFGPSDFSAAGFKYRAVFLRFASAVTACHVWLDSANDGVRALAAETPVSNAIQTIASESAAPTGVSWDMGTTEGTGIDIGTQSAGAIVGLWIRHALGSGYTASAHVDTIIHYSYTCAAVDYAGQLRGKCRYADSALELYLLFAGDGAEPDLTGTADASAAALPIELALAADHDWWLRTITQDAYGLRSHTNDASNRVIRLAADGTQEEDPPSAPSIVTMSAYTAGEVRVQAAYYPLLETVSADKATSWVLYLTDDGSTPDPAVDDAYDTKSMGGGDAELLDYTTAQGTWLEDQVIKCIPRTRRSYIVGEETLYVESTNSTVYSATVEYFGPARPSIVVTHDGWYGQDVGIQAAPDDEVTYVDETNNIYWLMKGGQTQLWADTVLVFSLKRDSSRPSWSGLYTTFAVDDGAISGAGTTDPIEVASWTGGDKTLYITVNGARVAKIDVTNLTITFNTIDGAASVSSTLSESPIWRKYAHTCIQVWDLGNDTVVTGASLTSAGVLALADKLVGCNTEGECTSET